MVASPKIVSPPIVWGELDDFSNFERGGGGMGGGDFRKLGGANLKWGGGGHEFLSRRLDFLS